MTTRQINRTRAALVCGLFCNGLNFHQIAKVLNLFSHRDAERLFRQGTGSLRRRLKQLARR